jgi:hypothetical protein
MRAEAEVAAAALSARTAASYQNGYADALDWAMSDSNPTQEAERVQSVRPHKNTYPRVLDILREAAEPLAISDIIREGRKRGLDLLRGTVTQGVTRAMDRNLVERVGHRYRVVPLPDER